MIKAILFDIDNTLLDFDKCSKSSILLACKKHNVPYSDELFRIFRKTTDIMFRQIEDGEISREDLRRTRWKVVFDALNIQGIDPVLFEDDFRVWLVDSFEEVDGATEIVKYLSTKYDLYCASNAPAGQQEHRMELAGLKKYFKNIFVSGNIGFYKPNKDFFDYCFSTFDNLKKDEVLMCGDDIHADMKGAISYGLPTCFYNKYKKEIIDCNPTYTITSLLELKNIL